MSEFFKRKARRYFSVFDLDRDGIISKNDFVGMAIRFAQVKKADKKKAENLKTEFETLFDSYLETSDAGDTKQLTEKMFIDSVHKQLHNPEMKKHFADPIRSLFYLMDVNCDGYLQPDEYYRMVAQLGVPDASFTKEAFKAIDVNGDGKLSIDEFINAFMEFMYSEDEKNPCAVFFGPLGN